MAATSEASPSPWVDTTVWDARYSVQSPQENTDVPSWLAGEQPNGDAEDLKESSYEKASPAQDDKNLVDWNGPNDPHNPMNWSKSREWITITLVSTITFNA